MTAFSDYLENTLIASVLLGVPYTPPATIYLGLHITPQSDDDSGMEVMGGSYSRVAVAFSAPSSGVTSNSSSVVFTPATASWGTVSHFGLYDAPAGGNLLLWGTLSETRTVDSGDVFTINAGTLSVSFD